MPKHDMRLFAAPIMWMFIVLAAMIFVIFAYLRATPRRALHLNCRRIVVFAPQEDDP
jgi:hypothetical protein